MRAGFVVRGIGRLEQARLRPAAATQVLDGALELLTSAGSVAVNGSHLHASLADDHGRVLGGHLGYGCRLRITAEMLRALLPRWHFSRELDAATGCDELTLRCCQGPSA